jgi:outer membrane biogenesis lipoprotein LolB
MKNYINLSFTVVLAMMVLFGCSGKSSENTNNVFKQTAEAKEVISNAVDGTNKGVRLATMTPYSV